jgi:SpoIIAA-like
VVLATRGHAGRIDLPSGTPGFRASGKITSDEYRQMIEPIYATLERGEKLNIYFELTDGFHGLDLGALWQNVQAVGSVGLKYRSSW